MNNENDSHSNDQLEDDRRLSNSKKNHIRSVDRALDLLCCFVERKQWTLTELTEKTGLHKTTVFRLLATLVDRGFLQRDTETEKYRLGIRIWELAAHMDQTNDLSILFLPEMTKLRDQLNETVSLYIRDGLERIRIQSVESQQTIRRVAPVGERMSLAVGASSKVLVAFAKHELIKQVVETCAGIEQIDFIDFAKKIDWVRKHGYAISYAERESGTAAIAVPILNRQASIVAALAVSGPISRMDEEQIDTFLPHLREAAQQMRNKLV
ncbi:transcriptional regulator, IclR family [Seinonella peptonophila]|uniref:Glycerol operon regulatory protein n=1 Tax=Seinonella peptonophila TaxID=112248 RepID=A0A1M5AKL3_9BACL|nr:IclR family transcriptional regulator [Seinonella peptonophila]SHF30657.1 transcriptional regulator, IclR family [Seinonella peptonophila]